MISEGQHFNPAEVVPEPGIYRCTKCSYTQFFTTDIKGFSFPQDHYTPAKWELIKKTEKPKDCINGLSRRPERGSFLVLALRSLRLLGRAQHPS